MNPLGAFISDLADRATEGVSIEGEALRLSDAVFVEPAFFRMKARLANIIEQEVKAELANRVRYDAAVKSSGFDAKDVDDVYLSICDRGVYEFIVTAKDGTEARVRVPVADIGDVVQGENS